MEYIKSLGVVLNDSLSGVWSLFANFVPILLLAIILFILGVIVASVVGKAIAQVITISKVDKLLESAGTDEFLSRMGMKLNLGYFFGVIAKWFIILVFLMASLQILKLTQVNEFIGRVLMEYLPFVVISAIILILTTIVADATKKIILASAKAANISSAQLLSSLAKYTIWVFSIMLLLSQFDQIQPFMLIIFGGVIFIIALGGGLAFGLGGKEAAARAIDSISKDLSGK